MSKLSAAEAKTLRAALRKRPAKELKAAFALIRAKGDAALIAALAPAKKKASAKTDPLLRALDLALNPVIAPAAEKADMLIDHIAKKRRRKLDIKAKGLADAARQLRKRFTDAEIEADAKSLAAHLTKLYGGREGVV
ncbi:MAG TPA: hypothetical protein PKY87_10225 [Terricaulis sp.]|nr:hypothetical protein [Terricaulis sp.]